jgi:hypothetical protein
MFFSPSLAFLVLWLRFNKILAIKKKIRERRRIKFKLRSKSGSVIYTFI